MSFVKHIEHAGRRMGRGTAFCDLLTFAVCALSMKGKEDEYLKTAKKYTPDEMMHFSHAFGCLVIDMDNHGEGLKDCLGDYFMEILSNERQGQFFTPQYLCDMMSQFTGPYENGKSLNDCCCGSGRMFLSAAKINRCLEFYGADIDLQCCQMTVINLCLNGLYGVVSHMDSLRMLEWRRWEVKLHPVYLTPYIREIDLSKIESIDVKIQTIEMPEIKPVQTTLDLLFESVDMLL